MNDEEKVGFIQVKFQLRPLVKRILIYGGITAGVALGVALWHKTNKLEHHMEEVEENADHMMLVAGHTLEAIDELFNEQGDE